MNRMAKDRLKTAAFLVPPLILIVVPVLAGMLYTLYAGYPLGIKSLGKLASAPEFLSSAFFTAGIAFCSALTSLGAGVFLAFVFRLKPVHFLLPAGVIVALPYIAAAALMVHLFSDSGILIHLLRLVFPSITELGVRYNPRGLGILAVYLFKAVPFVFLNTVTLFAEIDAGYMESARSLGLSPARCFLYVFIPNVRRSLWGTFILLFQFVLFSYEGFAFMGPSFPKGLGELLAVYYYSANGEYKTAAFTLNGIAIATALAFTVFYAQKMVKQK
jgi:putative spermidine/putrescine transport system permease protein